MWKRMFCMTELVFYRSNISGFPLEPLVTTAVHRTADEVSGQPDDKTRFFLNGETVGFYRKDTPVLYLLSSGPRQLQRSLDLTHKCIDSLFDTNVSFDPKKRFSLKAYGTARYARPRFSEEVLRTENEKGMMRFMEMIAMLKPTASQQYNILLSIDKYYLPIRG